MRGVIWICRVLAGIFAWLLLAPILIVLELIPITIYGSCWFFVTQILRRIFRRDLGPPVTKLDFTFTADDVYGKPRGACFTTVVLEGELPPEKLRRHLEGVFTASDALGNYDRLRCLYVTNWFGYPFWTTTKRSLDISKHLKVVPVSHEVEIQEVIEDWVVSPFATEQPLWDMILLHGYKGHDGNLQSTFGFRFHHILGDGISLVNFLENQICKAPVPPATPSSQTRRQIAMGNAQRLFWAPIVFAHLLYDLSMRRDFFSKSRGEKNELFLTDTTISLDKMKELRHHLSEVVGARVSFLSMLLLCFGGTLRKVIINELGKDVDGMNSLTLSTPFPRKTPHPVHNICNHWGMSFMRIPIGEKDPLKRLKDLVRQESWLVDSGATETNLILPTIAPMIPLRIYRKSTDFSTGITMGASNLVGNSTPLHLTENLVLKKILGTGLQAKNSSMNFVAHSYNGNLTISLQSHRDVFSRELNKKILEEYFHEEVDELLQSHFGLKNTTHHSNAVKNFAR